jgi:PRELI-like family
MIDQSSVRVSRISPPDWSGQFTRKEIAHPSPPQQYIMKVHSQTQTYEYVLHVATALVQRMCTLIDSYPWPIVTLAWFLRYPNPYALHVLSTDTIYQAIDPTSKILKVVRLHLKKGKLPVWSKRFLSHISESWIVETTEVDLRNGRMETRMRNLDHRKVLYVEERGTWSKEGNRYALECYRH